MSITGVVRGYIGLRVLPGCFRTTVNYERLRLGLNPYSLGMLALGMGLEAKTARGCPTEFRLSRSVENIGKSLHEAAYCMTLRKMGAPVLQHVHISSSNLILHVMPQFRSMVVG